MRPEHDAANSLGREIEREEREESDNLNKEVGAIEYASSISPVAYGARYEDDGA